MLGWACTVHPIKKIWTIVYSSISYILISHDLNCLPLPEHLSSPLVFSGVRVIRSLVLCVCFVDRSFVLLSFFFWPLSCLFFFWPLSCLFFDIRILITPLVSSNASWIKFSLNIFYCAYTIGLDSKLYQLIWSHLLTKYTHEIMTAKQNTNNRHLICWHWSIRWK